jgi:hypothetical protein
MNGKGSSPRNCFSPQFKENYDHIFRKGTMTKQEYRIVYDDDGHAYVIKADELTIFNHWIEAMHGRRHMPGHFKPVRLDSVESLRFTDWREEG